MLIGEIRDHETAQIAIEASLTGHLVLSTLHTNDAPSAITRLIEMGIEPFLVGSAVDCVLAQRLARRLCSKCKEEYVPTREALLAARFPWAEDQPLPTLYRAVGCSTCAKTGYKGRLALHEVMPNSESHRATHRRALLGLADPDHRRRRRACARCAMTGCSRSCAGVTSIDEILRVVV